MATASEVKAALLDAICAQVKANTDVDKLATLAGAFATVAHVHTPSAPSKK